MAIALPLVRWLDDHRVAIARLALATVVLLAALAWTLVGANPLILKVLIVLGGAALLLLVLRWPELGIVGIAGGTLAVPLSVGTGTETRLNVVVLVLPCLMALWVMRGVIERRAALLPSVGIPPALALLAVSLLSFLTGLQPWQQYAQRASLAAQAGGFAIWVLSVLAFLLMAHLTTSLRWLRATVGVYLAIAAVHLAGYVLSGALPGVGELSQALLSDNPPGSVFWIWVGALAFSQATFNRALAPPWRLALGGLVLAALYVGVIQQRSWTSGWLPPAIAIGVIVVLGAPRLLPALCIAAAALITMNAAGVYELVMGGDNEYSLLTRLSAWRIVAEITGDSPVIGLGFANYYWYTPYFPITGLDRMAYAVRFNSHNNYIDIVAQTGLLGLLAFGWFAVALLRIGWRLRKTAPAGFARAYALGGTGALAGMLAAAMLGDWVLPFVYNVGYDGFRYSVAGWLFLGGLLVVERTLAESAAETSRSGAVQHD